MLHYSSLHSSTQPSAIKSLLFSIHLTEGHIHESFVQDFDNFIQSPQLEMNIEALTSTPYRPP